MPRQKIIAPLNKGDEIRIVAPASVVEKEYIDNTVSALQRLGYKVSLGKNLYSENHQFAGTDEQRLSDFQEALNDPLVRAVFCARGGYGSVRIIDKLDFSRFAKKRKWIVGFSDITLFHAHLNSNFRIPTLHAPMPVNYWSSSFADNLDQLNNLLQGRPARIIWPNNPLNKPGNAKARLVGGNLSILYSLQSTPYELDTQNTILFIEDVGEQLYHLDRMLNNFRLSGKFSKLKGLLVGGFTAMKDKKRPFGKSFQEIIYEYVADMNIPVAFDFPAGHTDNNVPFILGKEVELVVNKNNVKMFL